MKKHINKAYAITNARISFVSLVDKAANKRRFLIKKEEDGTASFLTYGRIIKADEEHHYVTGIVYEPDVEDAHGNYMTEEEITKAAYWYAKNANKVDVQHSFEALQGAAVVENWVAKADFDCGGEKIAKGTWLMTVEVTDSAVWKDITNGKITGFSMGGVGNYSEEDDKLAKSAERTSLFDKLARGLGIEKSALEEPVEKAGKKLSSKNREALTGIYESLGTFLKEFDDPEEETEKPTSKKPEKKEKDDEESGVEEGCSAGKDKDDKAITKSEAEDMIAAAVSAAFRAVSGVSEAEKENTHPVEKSVQGVSEEALAALIEKALSKALENAEPEQPAPDTASIDAIVEKAVEKATSGILKAHGVATNLNAAAGTAETQPEEPHYMHGIL